MQNLTNIRNLAGKKDKNCHVKFWFKMAENVSDHNVYLSVLLNFFVDEDEDENKLFSEDNEEITSPDLDEPNFNEMKELKSSI